MNRRRRFISRLKENMSTVVINNRSKSHNLNHSNSKIKRSLGFMVVKLSSMSLYPYLKKTTIKQTIRTLPKINALFWLDIFRVWVQKLYSKALWLLILVWDRHKNRCDLVFDTSLILSYWNVLGVNFNILLIGSKTCVRGVQWIPL